MNQQLADSKLCWVDGEFLPEDSAVISSADAGLMTGMGVFDSLCGYAGKPFDLEKHYSRLCKDAEKIGAEAPSKELIESVLEQLMERNSLNEGRCRLRVSIFMLAGGQCRVVVNATELPQRDEFSKVFMVPYQVNEFSPLTGVKSSSYAANNLALKEAITSGGDEAMMMNTRGHLCEGTTSNIFLVKDGELYTPPLSSGCLPGVTRDTVLEIAREIGVIYHMRDLTLDDVSQSDEAFLTSSLREIQSIAEFDGQEMPAVNGELVQRLRGIYQERAWQ
jgi:branched-chain amino acid aminotransferase